MNKIKLSETSMGKVQYRFDEALAEVVANLVDPATDFKKDREITIKLKYRPTDEAREACTVTAQVSTKLQPKREIVSMIGVGINTSTGEIMVAERNQLPLFDEKPKSAKIAQING